MKKLFIELLAIAILPCIFVGCGGDKPGEGYPVVVLGCTDNLTSPDDDMSVDLKTVAGQTFSWTAPSYNGRDAISYELLLDLGQGDFSDPLHIAGSSLAEITLAASQLDDIAFEAGALPGGEVALKWAVRASAGSLSSLSSAPRRLTLLRAVDDDPVRLAPVAAFKTPAADASADLKTADELVFEWDAASYNGSETLLYEVLFSVSAGDFSHPVHVEPSTSVRIALSRRTLDAIAVAAGAGSEDQATLWWTVRARAGSDAVLSSRTRKLTLLRAMETYSFAEGENICISGAGSEEGQQFKLTAGAPVYELYTWLEAAKPYCFYSGQGDGKRIFSFAADGVRFKETTGKSTVGATVGSSGVYRIRLDFAVNRAVVQPVEKAAMRISWTLKETAFVYSARGVWKLENYNVALPATGSGFDERYKIIFTVDGQAEHWGQLGPVFGQRPAITREGYRDMAPTETGQWAGSQFKFPKELCDANDLSLWYTDIILSMTAEKNYTHDFVNCRAVEKETVKYANPLFTDYGLPDPDVIRADDGKFYLYATESTDASSKNVPVMRSSDLVSWSKAGTVFTNATHPQITNQAGARVWAPTVSRVGGLYVIYYSQPGNNYKHAIGVATSANPEGPFTDRGKLIDSNEQGVDISIDAYLYQEDGRNYLFWGSFRKISVIELTADGLSIKPGEVRKEVAGGQYEASYVIKRDGYYYLIVSTGDYAKNGTYKLVAGRSRNIAGPYVNKAGKDMMKVNHEIMLQGNAAFTSPGHCSRIITDDLGRDWILYHAYPADKNFRCLMLDMVNWVDGWPVVSDGYPSSASYAAPKFD